MGRKLVYNRITDLDFDPTAIKGPYLYQIDSTSVPGKIVMTHVTVEKRVVDQIDFMSMEHYLMPRDDPDFLALRSVCMKGLH